MESYFSSLLLMPKQDDKTSKIYVNPTQLQYHQNHPVCTQTFHFKSSSRLAGPVFVGLLVEGAGAVSAEVVERRLGQELLGVQLDEVLGVTQGDRHQRLQDGVDDVQYLKE